MKVNWSSEFSFTPEAVRQNAPTLPGIYEILQSVEYPRYEGKTRVLKIGESDADVKRELLNHVHRHTAANRLARIRRRHGLSLAFRYAGLSTNEAREAEKFLLRGFEDKHWDLPVLNSQRGYDRGEDRHYTNT